VNVANRDRATRGQAPKPRPDGISVVIPIHSGRLPLLSRLLSSLVASAARLSEPWECIVVDGSPEPEASAVAGVCAEFGAIHMPGPNTPSGKRNLGARSAKYSTLLFIDSDCIASEDLLPAHVRTLRQAPPEVAGVVGLTTFTGRASLAWSAAERSRLWACFGWARRFERVLWGATVNHSVRTAVFEEVGGFELDPYILSGGEDVALGVRITEAGYHLVTCLEALVLHDREHVDLRRMVTKYFMYGQAEPFLTTRFPGRTRRVISPVVVATGIAAVGLAGVSRTRKPLRNGAILLGALACGVGAMDLWRVTRLNRRRAFGGQSGRGLGGVPRADAASAPAIVLDLICVPLTWAYDLGLAVGALRRGRLDLVWQRFGMMDFSHFVMRPAIAHQPDGERAPVEVGAS
jgi:hypothetical protein